MPTPTLSSICLLIALFVADSMRAQRVLPASAATADANQRTGYPFELDGAQVQQLWDASVVCTTNAMITGFAFRADGPAQAPMPARTINEVTISLGHTTKTVFDMDQWFQSNRTSPVTQVFSGTVNLPAQTPMPLAPFNISFVASSPFAYSRASGNLLLDYRARGRTTQNNFYDLDAVLGGGGGSSGTFGTTGDFGTGALAATDVVSAGNAIPGGSATFRVAYIGASQPAPVALMFGLSNQVSLGLQLPFDLGVVGAPTNSLYCSFDFPRTLTLSNLGGFYAASTVLPIPSLPQLAGQDVYAQSIFTSPPSNPLGLVLTNAARVTIGDDQPRTQVLGVCDDRSPTGTFWFWPGIGGPVVRLDGTFN